MTCIPGASWSGPTAAPALDCEFAFYGPVGFDLSCLFGNYLFALARARVRRDEELLRFVRQLPEDTWNGFTGEVRALWPARVDSRVFSDAYLENWLQKVYRDAIGMTAAELCRRTIGFAHVSDIESLPERGTRRRRPRAFGSSTKACARAR